MIDKTLEELKIQANKNGKGMFSNCKAMTQDQWNRLADGKLTNAFNMFYNNKPFTQEQRDYMFSEYGIKYIPAEDDSTLPKEQMDLWVKSLGN